MGGKSVGILKNPLEAQEIRSSPKVVVFPACHQDVYTGVLLLRSRKYNSRQPFCDCLHELREGFQMVCRVPVRILWGDWVMFARSKTVRPGFELQISSALGIWNGVRTCSLRKVALHFADSDL